MKDQLVVQHLVGNASKKNFQKYGENTIYYIKEVQFKKTAPFSQNWFVGSRFLIGSTAHWPLF